MKTNLFTNTLIAAEILLFLLLPLIAGQGHFGHLPQPTPAVVLKEDGHPSVAQFKSYDENLTSDSFVIQVAKAEKEPAKEEITPGVQSFAVSIEDIEITPTTTPTPINHANSPQSLNEEQIQFLGRCEAGMDPTKNTGNGYYGAFQFSYGTWQSMNTGYERADMAPLDVQIDAVQRLLQRSSIYTQFPGCARQMASQGII